MSQRARLTYSPQRWSTRESEEKHVGYTYEKTVEPELLGSVEADAAKVQEKIDALRRQK